MHVKPFTIHLIVPINNSYSVRYTQLVLIRRINVSASCFSSRPCAPVAVAGHVVLYWPARELQLTLPPAADLAGNKEAALCQRGLSLSLLQRRERKGDRGGGGAPPYWSNAAVLSGRLPAEWGQTVCVCVCVCAVHQGGRGKEVGWLLAPRGVLVRHLSSYHQCCHIIERMGGGGFTVQKQGMAKGIS